MNKYFQLLMVCFIRFLCTAQEPEQQINEVNVVFKKLIFSDSLNENSTINRQNIEALQPEDLGELLRKIPGANVKSYGGLGGLKTVSVRGLGSQHTQVVIDGFGQMNTQTGQLNLGQMNLDNVESVILQPGSSGEISVPASAQLSGNTLIIESYAAKTPKRLFSARATSRIGSFDQLDQSIIFKIGNSTIFGGGFFKYRQANGAYPYQTKNYETVILGERQNNDYKDLNAGADLHFHFKKHRFNAYYNHFTAQQGLPGAIILYNDFARQRLATTSTQIKFDYQTDIKKTALRFYVNLSKDSIEYRDPNYFANDIIFTSSFTTNTGNFGLNLKRDFGTHFHLNAGIEQLMSTLNSRQSLHSTPQRLQNFSFLKGSFSKNNWKLIAQLGSQYVQEENTSGSAARDVFRLTPYIQAGKTLGKKYTLSAFYRNSFRMPSFNELYYNNIGNTQLKPEDAHQFSLSNSFLLLERKKTMISLQISGYYQLVNNMILAIPTKNLFVWSIQNIGRNEIIGSEAVLNINHQWSKNWSSELSSNYTFQNSVDVSDRKSPSYGNQIAYVPVHSGNIDLSILYKKHGIRISNFVSSKRYSLNENILANEVPAFSILDASIFGAIKWGDHSKIRLQFTVKNILNSSYAYVRSFVMPGRNYLITLSYEI